MVLDGAGAEAQAGDAHEGVAGLALGRRDQPHKGLVVSVVGAAQGIGGDLAGLVGRQC